MESVKIGILGLGTIGCGTVQILQRNQKVLHARLGTPVEIVKAADLDLTKS